MKVEPKDGAGWNFRQIGPVFFMCMSVLHSILQGDFPYAGVAGLVLIGSYHWAIGPAIKYRLIPGNLNCLLHVICISDGTALHSSANFGLCSVAMKLLVALIVGLL
jgi:hypothetical protein